MFITLFPTSDEVFSTQKSQRVNVKAPAHDLQKSILLLPA
jgi:hypothetical protein